MVRPLPLLLALGACKASISAGMDDGGTLTGSDAPADAAPLGPWATPVPVDIPAVGDDDPTATGDLLELYFNRDADIYVTRRASTSDAWDAPVAVTELNTADAETTPEVSYDGLTIYLASARTGGAGGNDIWMATRATRSDLWSTPVHVDELSSAAAEGAAASTHPHVITIDSDRAGTTLLDLYVATRTNPNDPWGTPVRIDELSTAGSEGNPMMTGDRLTLYFDSDRSGDGELYVATRPGTTAPFDAPQQITEVSSPAAESDPWISPDGRTLYFTSDRDGTLRLWQTTR